VIATVVLSLPLEVGRITPMGGVGVGVGVAVGVAVGVLVGVGVGVPLGVGVGRFVIE
jgi:hypothetical protein